MANGDLLQRVETIVIIMFENRSFDHMLGHLRLDGINPNVEGLVGPVDDGKYENLFEGEGYDPFHMRDGKLPCDLPHEREFVAVQLAHHAATNRYDMNGFVQAYYGSTAVNRTDYPEAMGFFRRDQVPITSFLAENFCVCDHWYAPLPASTLPNRLMFLTGSTEVDATGGVLPPISGTFILDWLTQRGVSWRVYHAGVFSFLWLLGRFDVTLGDACREFARFANDVATEQDGQFPKVILVEPSYGDAPRFGPPPSDNHAPDAVAPGEALLRSVYTALIANPARWGRTLLIVAYDEHGGFFDHLSPLEIGFAPGPGARYANPFTTTGPRVPGLVISPLIAARSVCQARLDHTSILQLLAERFGAGAEDYSAEVTARRRQGIRSLSDALTGPADPRRPVPPPAPSEPVVPAGPAGRANLSTPAMARAGHTPMQQVFLRAATDLVDRFPAEAEARFPTITQWRQTV